MDNQKLLSESKLVTNHADFIKALMFNVDVNTHVRIHVIKTHLKNLISTFGKEAVNTAIDDLSKEIQEEERLVAEFGPGFLVDDTSLCEANETKDIA